MTTHFQRIAKAVSGGPQGEVLDKTIFERFDSYQGLPGALTSEEMAVTVGNYFNSQVYSLTVASGGSISMLFHSNSAVRAVKVGFVFNAPLGALATFYLSPTVTSMGTALPAGRLNMVSSHQPVSRAYTGYAVSTLGPGVPLFVPPGQPYRLGGEGSQLQRPIIPPNYEAIVTLQNLGKDYSPGENGEAEDGAGVVPLQIICNWIEIHAGDPI